MSKVFSQSYKGGLFSSTKKLGRPLPKSKRKLVISFLRDDRVRLTILSKYSPPYDQSSVEGEV